MFDIHQAVSKLFKSNDFRAKDDDLLSSVLYGFALSVNLSYFMDLSIFLELDKMN
jgi:hypothetical protein